MSVAALTTRNVTIGGRRTSLRLEPSMWDALEDIARREGLTVNHLCTRIKDRLDQQVCLRHVETDTGNVTMTSSVRVFITAYFRRASTEDGHANAAHGNGDPFVGTPLASPIA